MLSFVLAEAAPDLHRADHASRVAPAPVVRALLRALVPDADGLRLPGLGLRATEAICFPLLIDGAKPLLRFSRAYAGLRLRDALALALPRNPA